MTTAQPGSLPASLAGIDMQAGMETAAMDAGLYRKLLLIYRKNHVGFDHQFAQARAGADGSAAARLAHSLRGTSGNIGAFGVLEAAQALEALCARNADARAIDAALAAVMRELAVVLPALAAVAAPPAAASVTPPIDRAQWSAKLARLRALVRDNDAEALDLARELAASPPDEAAARLAASVVDVLDVFDFDAALRMLSP